VLDGLDEEMSEEEAAPGGDLAIEADRKELEDMIRRAESLRGPAQDPKLRQLIRQVQGLLAEGFRPVIFCRFRPTAHYLAEQLSEALPKRSVVIRAVTGELPPEERVERIAELEAEAFAGEKPPKRQCWWPPIASQKGSNCSAASMRWCTTTSAGTRPATNSGKAAWIALPSPSRW
jgi:hypothetical protein